MKHTTRAFSSSGASFSICESYLGEKKIQINELQIKLI